MPRPRSMTQIRAGVIGAGFIGPVHIEALRRLGVQVTSICGSEAARAIAAKWGIPNVYTGYDDRRLIESPEVDVVHIASPNRFHHRSALAAIEAGKHVVCEKPLAMTSRQTAAIAERAARRPQVFAVNYNIRFYPAVLQLKSAVARGDLGRIIHVNGSYFQDWLLEDTDYNWRVLPEEGGRLRAVADIGTHWLDAVSFILGSRVAAVLAHLETWHKTRRRPRGEVRTFTGAASSRRRFISYAVKTEDFASILLRFADGTHGNLAVSQVAAGRKNCLRIEIYGDRRSAFWNSEYPEVISYGSRDGGNEIALRNTPPFSADVAEFTDYPAGHCEGFPDTFKMLYRAVYRDVLNGRSRQPLYATAADGHHEALVCDAVLESRRTGRWVEVAEGDQGLKRG